VTTLQRRLDALEATAAATATVTPTRGDLAERIADAESCGDPRERRALLALRDALAGGDLGRACKAGMRKGARAGAG